MCWNRLNLTLAALFIATASQLQAGVIVTGSLTGTIGTGSDTNNTLGHGMTLNGETIVIDFFYDTMMPPAPADSDADSDLGTYESSTTSDPGWFQISSVTIGGVAVPVSAEPLQQLDQLINVNNGNPSSIEYRNTRETRELSPSFPPIFGLGFLQTVDFQLNGGAAGVFGSDALPLHVDLDDFANGNGTFLLFGNDEPGAPAEGNVDITADFMINSFASSASVPEPSSIAMLGLGAIGLVASGFLRRRKNLATAS